MKLVSRLLGLHQADYHMLSKRELHTITEELHRPLASIFDKMDNPISLFARTSRVADFATVLTNHTINSMTFSIVLNIYVTLSHRIHIWKTHKILSLDCANIEYPHRLVDSRRDCSDSDWNWTRTRRGYFDSVSERISCLIVTYTYYIFVITLCPTHFIYCTYNVLV